MTDDAGLMERSDTLSDLKIRTIPVMLSDELFVAHVYETSTPHVIQLQRQICSGRYSKPFVLESRDSRQLHIGLEFTQSRMNLRAPNHLDFTYTRMMMSFLLFNPAPRHIVIVGLGGGCLSKYCYQRLPNTRVSTIEIDEAIIKLSSLFDVPASSERMRILHANAADYFRTTDETADVVILDGCDAHGTASALCEESFYEHVHSRLQGGGIFAANLAGPVGRSSKIAGRIDRVFGGNSLVLPVTVGDNVLVFARRNGLWPSDWSAIQQRAVELERQHKLQFTEYASQLAFSARRENHKVRTGKRRDSFQTESDV